MLLSPPPKMQFFGDDGLPLSGGLVYTYAKDTTTPLATYTDSTGSVANANPIVLDPYGYASVWFQILPYSLVIQDSLGVVQNSSGPIEFSQVASSGTAIAAWSDIVVYNYPDQVAGSDGYTYRCVGTNILDDDPVGSVTGAWVNLSSLASAALTGTPTAPTAAAGTNTTQIATTAFVQTAVTTATNTVGGRSRDIIGGDITVSANTLTITACGAWDSTKLIWLETTVNKTLVIPSVNSTLYYVFLVRLVSDSSLEFRSYTTEAGPASDTQINAYRFISIAKTNGSAVVMPFRQIGNRYDFITADRPSVTATTTSSYVSYTLSSLLPTGLLETITFVNDNTLSTAVSLSYNGTDLVGILLSIGVVCELLSASAVYAKHDNFSTFIKVISIKLRRA